MKYLTLIIALVMISGVFASDYYVEFNQVGDNLVMKENNLSGVVINDGLDKTDFGYYFIKKIKAQEDYDNLAVRLNLDYGVIAKNGEIFPVGYLSSSDGQTISIIWNYTNVSKGREFAFFVSLEDTKINVSYSWVYILAIVILVFVGFFLFKHFRNRKDVGLYLLDDEKKVIGLLKNADKKCLWQKSIQSSLGFSKAKLSRLIRNLESRGLIKKIPMGNTNKIQLK